MSVGEKYVVGVDVKAQGGTAGMQILSFMPLRGSTTATRLCHERTPPQKTGTPDHHT